MFAFTFSEITRYFDILEIILDRYKTANQAFVANTKALQASIAKNNSNLVSEEQNMLLSQSYGLSLRVHLEIESFYLFAKILLDKIALAIQFYFGQPERKLSLASHDKLAKHIESYARVRGLSFTQDLLEIIKKLKLDIADFRDYQIQHIPDYRHSRVMRGTIYDSEGNTRLSVNALYPRPVEKQYDSKHLHELLADIEAYIEKVVLFIEQNKNKTGLALNTSQN